MMREIGLAVFCLTLGVLALLWVLRDPPPAADAAEWCAEHVCPDCARCACAEP